MNKTTVFCLLALLLLMIVLIVLYSTNKLESFEHQGIPAQLNDGMYSIQTQDGLDLSTDFFDVVTCKQFAHPSSTSNQQKAWTLKRVTNGVYIIYKQPVNNQDDKQCLYAHPSNQLRTFSFHQCYNKNLCGLENTDYEGKLDSNSLKTYFMILQHPNGQYYIKNVFNNQYIDSSNNKTNMVNEPTKNSLFTIAFLSTA